jgi:two-component system, NtrC family, response regulator AtoC
MHHLWAVRRTPRTAGEARRISDDADLSVVLAWPLVTSEITGGTSGSLHHVLLVGPDDEARRALHLLLDRAGKQVAAVAELEHARSYLGDHPCDAVIAGGEVAAQLVRATGAPPVIAVIRPRDAAVAIALLEAGVDEVVTDPLDELALTLALRHVAALPRRTGRVAAPVLIGDGSVMQRLRAMIERVAATRSTVLILGESGTGKELVARAIHAASPRRGRRFVAINCAAIPGPLLESELFGHRRGAFTDAVRDKRGLFEDADGGTLLLDEIGELPLALQAKLLRALQDGEIRRVGDTASQKIDVRLIAATLRDLADDVRAGRFREDLYYRLNVLPVEIPPLRERTEDIPQLARFFASRHAARHKLGEVELSEVAIDALVRQAWPGNVRELENVLERAVVLADDPAGATGRRVIDLGDLGGIASQRTPGAAGGGDALSIKKATRDIEQDLIRRALDVTLGNRTNAAKLLEISHRALLYKMKEYGIT